STTFTIVNSVSLTGANAARVQTLCAAECCHKRCQKDKQEALEYKTALLTALAFSDDTPPDRRTGKGVHKRSKYVGVVCKKAFQMMLDIANRTLTARRNQLASGFYPKHHANTKNQHAAYLDKDNIIKWFEATAEKLAPSCLYAFASKKPRERYQTKVKYTFLQAYLTWAKLRELYVAEMKEQDEEYVPLSLSSLQMILRKHCENLSSNVCDVCSIHHLQSISGGMSVEKAEAHAKHAADATAMRLILANVWNCIQPIELKPPNAEKICDLFKKRKLTSQQNTYEIRCISHQRLLT
ncbi:TPA: hypothetical protein N0F65_003340, partial [Lagenidium giganteum]